MENLLLIIVFIVLSLAMVGIVLNHKDAKRYKFRTIFYVLVGGLLIGGSGFLGNKELIPFSNSVVFYLLMLWMLVLGLLHVIFYDRILLWAKRKHLWTELAFTLGIAFLGAALLLLAFHFSHFPFFATTNLVTLLVFLVPFLFYFTYLFYLNIPVKVLRKWQYPVDIHVDDPTDREMESPLVVGFEFRKRAGDEAMTTFRAKAPKEMTFGKLFYYFINDYNDRNPDEKIEYLDENNHPYDWIFHHKPKWFSTFRYIDPEETNAFNFIKENSVIVCKRVIEK